MPHHGVRKIATPTIYRFKKLYRSVVIAAGVDQQGSTGRALRHDCGFECFLFRLFPRPRVADFADNSSLDSSSIDTYLNVADYAFG